MKKNPIRFLGLLGVLGLLGLITGNTGFFGFFGLARQTDDEMLRHNLARAGFNAFIVSLLGFPVAVVSVSFMMPLEAMLAFFVLFFAGLFIIQILTFVLSFNIYEKRGNMR